MPSISSIFIISLVLISFYFTFFGLAPSISSISIWSLIYLGGVNGLCSTSDTLYLGFKGSPPNLVVENFTQFGLSTAYKLNSGFWSPMWSAAGLDLAISQLVFENSGLFTCFDPWSFGDAPEIKSKYGCAMDERLTMNIWGI